ncbi:MAG TPA: serine/threonine-protein kinase [Polyangiaceae bacterium]|nr:serine/threonine-protein kinase [Polyangiaceae bacterium]
MLDAPGRPDQRITLGRYDLLAQLGRGGMADVYLAVAGGLAGFQKLSVLKVLRPHVAQDEESLTMFLDEARLSANFSHPNVVHTHGVEQEGDLHYIVMEYLEGRSLAQLEAEQPDLPLPLRLRALADALHGLHYAHELTDLSGQSYNVVHRDVSPQNIFVTYGGRSKIVDFGVAKARHALSQTRQGTYKGKLRYMAPEQLTGEAIDRRADVFSAGAVLWAALTGRRLWEGLDQYAIMHRLTSREPVPRPGEVLEGVPAALDAACAKALAFDPRARFATAAEFAAVIETHLGAWGTAGSHRAVGRYLDERYADMRKRFRAAVDARLRLLRDAPVSVPLARGSSVPSSAPPAAPPVAPSAPPGAPSAPPGGPPPRGPGAASSHPPAPGGSLSARSAAASSHPPAPGGSLSARPAAASSHPPAPGGPPSARPTAPPSDTRPPPGPVEAPPLAAGPRGRVATLPVHPSFDAAPESTGLTPSRLFMPTDIPQLPPRAPTPPPDFAPSPPPAPRAPSAPPAPTRRSFAPYVLIALFALAAVLAPWWPRLWPRVQAAMPKAPPLARVSLPGASQTAPPPAAGAPAGPAAADSGPAGAASALAPQPQATAAASTTSAASAALAASEALAGSATSAASAALAGSAALTGSAAPASSAALAGSAAPSASAAPVLPPRGARHRRRAP